MVDRQPIPINVNEMMLLLLMQHYKQILTIAEMDLQDPYLDVVINLCVHVSGVIRPEMVRLFEYLLGKCRKNKKFKIEMKNGVEAFFLYFFL